MREKALSISFRSFPRKLNRRSAEILLEPMQFRGARDRHDPRLLREQPSERDLGGRRMLARGDGADEIDHGLIGLARLGREAGQGSISASKT
jgi:hypothetical protein